MPDRRPWTCGYSRRAVFGAVQQGHTVDVGGQRTFATVSGKVLDWEHFGGIVYTRVPRALEAVADVNALLAVALTEHEMAVVNEYGATPVLTVLGESPEQNSRKTLEDGFALLLTAANMKRARQALATGGALALKDASGDTLLEIRPSE